MARVRDKPSKITSREPVLFSRKFLITFLKMRRSRTSLIEVFLILEMFQTIPEFAKDKKSRMLDEGLPNLETFQILTRVLVKSKLLIEHLPTWIK
mgnify:CR=1 FL=1